EQLADDPEGEVTLELPTPRGQDAQVRPCCGPSGSEQARFADPRRPFEEQSTTRTGASAGKQAFDRFELELALDERSHLHTHESILGRLRLRAYSDRELEPVPVRVEYDALVAAALAGALGLLEDPITGRREDAAELVDGVGGSECEPEVQQSRRLPLIGRTVGLVLPLEDLEADAAEIEGAGAQAVLGAGRERRDDPSE